MAYSISAFFATERQQRWALDSLGDWFDPIELDLYDVSKRAFQPSQNADKRLQSFREAIYSPLASPQWNVFRPHSPAECWPAERIFETIRREFARFAWGGPVNLLNFQKSVTRTQLESCLEKLRGLKPKKHYPLMAVSKFLHFYNPELFPIYDNKMIWEKVLNGCFKLDYYGFCEREKIPHHIAFGDDSAAWLYYYMLLGSSLLSAAHPAFMQVFVDWLEKQLGSELQNRTFDVSRLYARAFEYTITGAALSS